MFIYNLILLFSLVLTIWYFIGIKLNKKIAKEFFLSLESILKPAYKNYINIGGSIGYHANYNINDRNIEKINCSLFLLPRHSLLWLPFSVLIFRSDRVRLLFSLKKRKFEYVYIYKKGAYFSKRVKTDKNITCKEELYWGDAYIFCRNKENSFYYNIFGNSNSRLLINVLYNENQVDFLILNKGRKTIDFIDSILSQITNDK